MHLLIFKSRKLLWTEDGWPVISPLVYAGEKEQKIPKEMIYGTWGFIKRRSNNYER